MDAKDYIRVFEQSSELLVVIDTNFVIVAASNAFLKTSATVRENIVGCNIFEVFPDNPNDITAKGEEKIRASFNRVIKNKTEDVLPVIRYDIAKPSSEGDRFETKYWKIIHSPILDANNNVKYIIQRAEDVTENETLVELLDVEHKALKLVEDSEKRYNMMLMKSPFAFAILKGKEMVITLANDAVKEIWGKGKDLEGKPLLEILPEIKDSEFPALLDKVYTTGIPFTGEELVAPVFRNGKLEDVYFYFVYQPYLEADETISGVTIIAYEVTEQVIAKKKVEESEHEIREIKEQLELSIKTGKIGVWFWDVKKDKLTWNDEQKEIYGFSASEEITSATQFNDLIVPEDLKRIEEDQSAGTKIEHEYDFRIIRKHNGELRWIKSRAKNTLDQQGTLQYISGVNIDITDQVIAKSKAEAAQLVAENAMHAKQQFLSNMSHEIRTPMNIIMGFANVLLKSELDKTQQEYLTAIKVSADSLLVLINDILDLAKVDAGKMTFEQTPFNLATSLSAMLQLFDIKMKEKNLALAEQFDIAIPEIIIGDPLRLRQIILNLISNAVKFTEVGKITMRVALLKQDAEKVTIEFTITDTGIGIPKNKLEHIFDDFEQATDENSRLYGGTGLGLTIVKKLIELQGGTIQVESELGKGSSFSFQLSFIKTDQKIQRETELVLSEQAELKNISVLVAEDAEFNQLLIKIILANFGFEVDIAGNGKIAIEKLQQNKYDLILMDLHMPEMNGFEATKYIRQKMNSQIPIIALTAAVTTVDVDKCEAFGMNDYISKPIDVNLLYDKIIKYLKKSN